MNKLFSLTIEPIVPRGFKRDSLQELPISPGDDVDNFINNPNIFGNKFDSVKNSLVAYTQFALAFASYILIIALIYSGVKYIIAGSDETKLASAKKNLYWSIIGFIIVNSAYVIYSIIKSNLEEKIPDASKISASSVTGDITLTLAKIISYSLGIIGVLFLLMLLINSFRYLISAGGEGTEPAKKGLINAIIGIVIVSASYAVTMLIKNTLLGTS